MSFKAKFVLAFLAALWLLFFFKGRFLHDGPKANEGALLSKAKIFRDVRFRIARKEMMKDGSYDLSVVCDYQDKPAGFEVLVKPREDDRRKGIVYFRNLGAQSTRSIAMLNDYYQTELPSHSMATQVKFDMKVVKGLFDDADQSPVKMELGFPARELGRDAVFYIEMDMGQGTFYLSEKDTDYRKPILWALEGV
jgi:hypothetical protein